MLEQPKLQTECVMTWGQYTSTGYGFRQLIDLACKDEWAIPDVPDREPTKSKLVDVIIRCSECEGSELNAELVKLFKDLTLDDMQQLGPVYEKIHHDLNYEYTFDTRLQVVHDVRFTLEKVQSAFYKDAMSKAIRLVKEAPTAEVHGFYKLRPMEVLELWIEKLLCTITYGAQRARVGRTPGARGPTQSHLVGLRAKHGLGPLRDVPGGGSSDDEIGGDTEPDSENERITSCPGVPDSWASQGVGLSSQAKPVMVTMGIKPRARRNNKAE